MNVLGAVWTKYRVPLLMRVKNYKGLMVAKKQGAYQLEQPAGAIFFRILPPGGRPGGSGPVWAWERPPPRAIDGRCPPLRPVGAVEDTCS
jgi:hypothetical protein